MNTSRIPEIGRRRRQAAFVRTVSVTAMVVVMVMAIVVSVSVSTTTSTTPLVEAFATSNTPTYRSSSTSTSLCMAQPNTGSSSLKPAATPLMDSGKALARSGELLIDLTTALDLYGGALSAAGANLRNSGDCLAQAAASCRFKTGQEIVIDELREAATCLAESTAKLTLAVEEAEADQNPTLQGLVYEMVGPTKLVSNKLEESGARIMMRDPLSEVGSSMVEAAAGLEAMSACIKNLAESSDQNADGLLSAQRMMYAADRLNQAGIELKGEVDNSKKNEGRGFLKGGF